MNNLKYKFAGMDKCRDRGLQKWAGFFMTEHNKELRDFYSQQNNEDWIGDLDDDYKFHISDIVNQIEAANKRATVKYHTGRNYEVAEGVIEKFGDGVIGLDTNKGYIEIPLDKVSDLS